MAITIMLDAGHYGKYNRSPVVKDYWESDMAWALQLELKKELEAYGFKVLTTRENKDKDLSLEQRGLAAKGCDIFLSLHSNACDNETVDRVEVYRPFDRKCADDIGGKLAAGIAELMGASYGCVKTRESAEYPGSEYYGVMRGARKAGVPLYFIIEHSFHTNTNATKWLMDKENLLKLAVFEAGVIAGYYGYSKIIHGDVNGDGKVNSKDYMMVKRYVTGTLKLTDEQLEAADISGDGKVNAKDYMMIKRAVLNQ